MDEQKTSSIPDLGEEKKNDKKTENKDLEEKAVTTRIRRPRPEGEKTDDDLKKDSTEATTRMRKPRPLTEESSGKTSDLSEKTETTTRLRRPRPESERGSYTEDERKTRSEGERRVRPEGERRPRPEDERRTRPEGERRPRPEGERRPRPEGERRPRPEGERRTRPEETGRMKNEEEVRNRTYVNKEPQHQSGTMRDNLDKYRTDNVDVVKKRQANASQERDQRSAAMKKKRQQEARKAKRKGVIIRIATAVLIALICVLCFIFSFNIFNDTAFKPDSKDKVEITVSASSSDAQVGKKLEELGVIESASMYKLRAKVYDADYVDGTYKVSPGYTTEKIINILSGYDYSDGTISEDD